MIRAFHRGRRPGRIGTLAAASLLLAAPAAGEENAAPDGWKALVGEYRHSTVTLAGQARRSVATITRHGDGFAIAWQEDEGNLFGGIGLSLDGVFGAAYTEALNGVFRGSFVAAYRIDGGTLEGLRMARGGREQIARETLQGAPGLEGRYDILRSDAGAAGHIEIARQGDTYQITWHTAEETYDGAGLRVGDVLIAGFARGFAPAIVAYCADAHVLTGLATYGHSGTVTPDRLVQSGTDGNLAVGLLSARCHAAVTEPNPSLKLD